MKISKSIALASFVAFSVATVGINSSTAAPFTRLPISSLPLLVDDQSVVVEIRHHRRGYKRRHKIARYHGRRYHRSRHHRRHRGYRHNYGDIWYSIPFWAGPLISVPRRYNRCDRWSRTCYRNWGPGRNYYGCMRYQRCR